MPKTQTTTRMMVIREKKENVQRYFLCLMDKWSGCGMRLDEFEQDRAKKHKRGCCPADYQVVSDMVRDGLIKAEEAEAAGMWRPIKRQLQKRILTTILARRTM